MVERLSEELEQFIEEAEWKWAKTYADTWPHHYIVRDRVDKELFLKFVKHIREYGEWEHFYNTPLKYFEQNSVVYWTMVPKEQGPKWYPPEEEDIINKCPAESTYKNRLKEDDLPE